MLASGKCAAAVTYHVFVGPVRRGAVENSRVHVGVGRCKLERASEEWGEDRSRGGVRSIPHDTTDAGREPVAGLHNVRLRGAEERDGAFPVALKGSRDGEAIRVAESAGSNALAGVELSAVVERTVNGSHLLHIGRLVWLHERRVHVGLVADVGVVRRQGDGWGPDVVGPPHAAATVKLVGVFAVAVHLCEVKQTLRRVPPTLLLSDGVHVVASEEVHSVVEIDFANGEHVGHNANLVVGDALSRPDGRGAGVIGKNVEDESFFGVDHHQGLGGTLEASSAVEPVLDSEVAHELDGHAGRVRSLERNAREGID